MDWQELPVKGPAEGVFRKTFVNLVTQWVQQLPLDIAPPTSMDDALSIAATAVETTDLQTIAGKLANIVGQALAHHVGCGMVATEAGALLQAAVISMPFPANPLAEAVNDTTVGVVAFDLHDGRLTSTVLDFTIGKSAQKLGAPATSARQVLQAIQAGQQPSREALPKPGEKPPDSDEQAQPDRENLKSSPRRPRQP